MGLTVNATGLRAFSLSRRAASFSPRKRTSPEKTVALAGNPNVGKSTLFNNLTGLHQHTGNWCGKTVGIAQGRCRSGQYSYLFVDIPGTYSLSAHSAEEGIAGDFLRSEELDACVVICDATCLERGLILLQQVMEIVPRVLLCVNLMDEARRKGIHVDLERLHGLLDIPVVGTAACSRSSRTIVLHALDQLLAQEKKPRRGPSSPLYVTRAAQICREAVHRDPAKPSPDRRIDRILTSPAAGYPVMLGILLLLLWITVAGANYPSQALAALFSRLEEALHAAAGGAGMPRRLESLLFSGVYRTVASVVSVMLPPMAIFFPLFTLLEDVGYLPRAAYNLDYHFQKCRSCGKQALTMAMGFGCNAAGTVGCRIIDSPRERLIAILTNSFVPCNGRFPTLYACISMFLLGAFGRASGASSLLAACLLTAFLLLSVLMTFAVSRLLSATLLKGEPSFFALELPPYRLPRVGKVLLRSVLDRTAFLLGRAILAAVPAGILIWFLANTSLRGDTLLSLCAGFLDPFARLCGLDGTILMAFLLGLPANEIVLPIILMAYSGGGSLQDAASLESMRTVLAANGWTWTTAVSMCLFSLMHWPCATTLLTIRKETGSLKWTIAAALISFAAGTACCMLFHAAVRVLF